MAPVVGSTVVVPQDGQVTDPRSASEAGDASAVEGQAAKSPAIEAPAPIPEPADPELFDAGADGETSIWWRVLEAGAGAWGALPLGTVRPSPPVFVAAAPAVAPAVVPAVAPAVEATASGPRAGCSGSGGFSGPWGPSGPSDATDSAVASGVAGESGSAGVAALSAAGSAGLARGSGARARRTWAPASITAACRPRSPRARRVSTRRELPPRSTGN